MNEKQQQKISKELCADDPNLNYEYRVLTYNGPHYCLYLIITWLMNTLEITCLCKLTCQCQMKILKVVDVYMCAHL